jgi:hypothetical protein
MIKEELMASLCHPSDSVIIACHLGGHRLTKVQDQNASPATNGLIVLD